MTPSLIDRRGVVSDDDRIQMEYDAKHVSSPQQPTLMVQPLGTGSPAVTPNTNDTYTKYNEVYKKLINCYECQLMIFISLQVDPKSRNVEFYRQVTFDNLLQNGKSQCKRNRHLLRLSRDTKPVTSQSLRQLAATQTSPQPESSTTMSQSSQSSGNNNNNLYSSPFHEPSSPNSIPLNYSYYAPQSLDLVPPIVTRPRHNRSRHNNGNSKHPHTHKKSHRHRRHTVNYEFDDFDGNIHSIYSNNNNNNGFGLYGEFEPMLKKSTNYRVYRRTYENRRASEKYPNSPYMSRRSRDRRSNVFDYETSNFDLGALNEDGT